MSCKQCGTRTHLWCLGCERVQYCGSSCQQADWTTHVTSCAQQTLIGEGTLVHMLRRAPDRFDQNVFWSYLRARRPSLKKFVMDLADEEGIDESNRLEWLRARDRVLGWVFSWNADEQARLIWDIEETELGTKIIKIVAAYDFAPLMRRIMNLPNFDAQHGLAVAIEKAAKYGSMDVLRMALAYRSDDELHVRSQAALSRAAFYGHTEAVRLLLSDNRFDPRRSAWGQDVPIIEAAAGGDVEVTRLLLQDPRVDPSVDDNEALKLAAQDGHEDVFRVLLADPRVDPSFHANYMITDTRSVEIVRMLLADPRVRLDQDLIVRTVARDVEPAILRALLQDGRVDPAWQNQRALVEAVARGKNGAVLALLEDPRVTPNVDDVLNPLFAAVRLNRPSILRILLRDPRTNVSYGSYGAVKMAVDANLVSIVEAFAKSGRVNMSSLNNRLVRVLAARGRAELVRVILKEERRVRATFSKEDAQGLIDNTPNITPAVREVLENYIREIQRGQPLDDSEPPSKMIKDRFLWN